ncbi:MAG: hypothetical protein KDK40_05735 [Chlamydiia bacterium]|nr:hypothetical protein [Chlamydiia bacterium]
MSTKKNNPLRERLPLTPKQQRVFQFISQTLSETEIVPSIREIQSHFEMSSPSVAHRYVDQLVEKGWLQRMGEGSRQVRPTEIEKSSSCLSLLIQVGFAPGKLLIPLQEPIEVELPSRMLPPQTELVGVEVVSEVLGETEHLSQGDWIILHAREAMPEELVIGTVDGVGVIGRFRPMGEMLSLEPSYGESFPLTIPTELFHPLGVVVYVFRCLNKGSFL